MKKAIRKGIRTSVKIIIICTGMALLLLHFVMTGIYASPFKQNAVKSKTDYVAMYYAAPYFHQNWNLFAPPPTTNYRLFAQFENNGFQKKEIFNSLLVQHQANRFKGLEPLVISFANSIHYFEKNSPMQNAINGPVMGDINFTILEHAARNYLQQQYGSVGALKLVLYAEDIQSKQQRIYFN